MKRSLGTPDVLAKLGRPGFPKGMVVMLVGGSAQERLDIQAQMSNLGYQGELPLTLDIPPCRQHRERSGSSWKI